MLIDIPAGSFVMGNDAPPSGCGGDGEGPAHTVDLGAYRIGAGPVTNDQFAAFIDATGHRTSAEEYGWSFVFGGLLPDDFPPTRGVASAPWWRQVMDASWDHPEGPNSSIDDRGAHPVVHVSWLDAVAFCDWAGMRLATEAEWECAARGGLEGHSFPWGGDLEPDGEHRMNVFQGDFPPGNTAADGWIGTNPVGYYPPNGFGLFDVTGNVWEWCADWYDQTYYSRSPTTDPPGPDTGENRVLRGGSYLCHASYCTRYRVDARSGSAPDSTTGNTGFRVAAS